MGEIMENREIAIQLKNVKKMYKLGQIGGGTLQADLQSWWARKRGKEDPNTKIDADQRLIGKTFMALNGIDLTIYKGEAVGIIGSNGAGKSTMLKLLSRVTAPTEGEIDIYGRIASMLEVGTGFHPEMTGRENVYLNGAILGMTKEEIDAKMEQIIEFSEVRDFIDTPVKRYSSGMFVKLAFSVAAHLDSEIMIMDEVLAVGDMAFQKKCLTKMREAAQQDGRTVLYVSHNMNTIRQLCDRCIVLDKGKVVFEGKVESAIAIYLQSNIDGSLPVKYCFKEEDRKGFITNGIVMGEFEIHNKESAIFLQNEIIPMELTFESNIDYDNVSFRFQVYYNGYQLVGSTFLDKSFSVKIQNTYSVEFFLDTTGFVPGNYSVDILVFTHDGNGNARAVDVIRKRISFQVIESEKSTYHWWVDPFGYVQYKDLTTVRIKEFERNADDKR